MCGISGVAARTEKGVDKATLQRMTDAMAHRGPDDQGYYISSTKDNSWRICLGHRRLSIIDLDTGRQPMTNETGEIHIVFNGEIYNFKELQLDLISKGHKFATASDTETIIHAYEEYGDHCVEHLRGMFAFAIWDSRKDRLFLARDRIGIKPLFFWKSDDYFIFASEIKAILQLSWIKFEIDFEAVNQYLTFRYIPAPKTLIKSIFKLMPGHTASWEAGVYNSRRYWYPPDRFVSSEAENSNDPVVGFLGEIDEAVRIRMMSDVPFGAFLSGGLDSSSIVALMCRHSNLPVKTFSVGFAEPRYSELAFARLIAKHFKTAHHELIVKPTDIIDNIENAVAYRDAPVSEPADIPIYLLSKEARRSVKMVLTGEGADEVLGGYSKHMFERFVRSFQRIPYKIRHDLIEPLIKNLPYRYHQAKTAIVNLNLEDERERFPRWFGVLDENEKSKLLRIPLEVQRNPGPHYPYLPPGEATTLRRILYSDQMSWLPDNLLERGDRMTMAASLEARVPFLDHKLMAFVSSLPDYWRVRGLSTKILLREAMKPILPQRITNRSKMGFAMPLNVWLRHDMRDYVVDMLVATDSITRDYYNPVVLKQVLTDHLNGRHNHEKLLWTLLNLELWHRIYRLS